MPPELLYALFAAAGSLVTWIAQRRGWKLPNMPGPLLPGPSQQPAGPGGSPVSPPGPLPTVPVDQISRVVAEQVAALVYKALDEAMARLIKELSDKLGRPKE